MRAFPWSSTSVAVGSSSNCPHKCDGQLSYLDMRAGVYEVLTYAMGRGTACSPRDEELEDTEVMIAFLRLAIGRGEASAW